MRLLVFLLAASGFLFAQPKTASLPQFPAARQITRASGMIFSGVVVEVRRFEGTPGPTQITFRVENAMRGVRRGQIVRVREWGGLWNSGERYTRGERVLLFLYPNSRLGLTSPVGGRSGRYAVDSVGRVLVRNPWAGVRPVPLKTVKAEIQRAAQE